MKKYLLILLIIIFYSCVDNKVVDNVESPFKSGEMIYFKIDTTMAVIKFDLGKFDDVNYAYVVSYKEGDKIKGKWFVLSSEIFKK
jgi:hypothetical protein